MAAEILITKSHKYWNADQVEHVKKVNINKDIFFMLKIQEILMLHVWK